MTNADLELNTGWLDTNISEVLNVGRAFVGAFQFVLITSLDSSTDLSIIPAANEAAHQCSEGRFLGGGLLIRTRDLLGLAKQYDLFNGFDELWVFDTAPTLAKPADVSIVGPLNFSTSQPPPRLAQWMADSVCRLGLGDGIGLNYAAADKVIAGRLVEIVEGDQER